ncbi:MAG TPA: hypothetical protein VFC46_15085, partial [Humisphaera sp.]|nr:hypothetical protein [Humisphaera sp.]
LYYLGVNNGAAEHETALDQPANDLWNLVKQGVPNATEAGTWEQTLKRRSIKIEINNDAMKAIHDGEEIPKNAKVEVSDGAKEIFPKAATNSSWENFVSQADSQQKTWSESLPIVIRMLNSKKTRSPVLPLIRGSVAEPGGVLPLYRPAVAQRDEMRDGRLCFHIEFVRTPDANSINTAFPPDTFYHWLMLARNFREGTLERYREILRESRTGLDAVLHLTDLFAELRLINMEVASRGLAIDRGLKNLCHPAMSEAIDDQLRKWSGWERELGEISAKLQTKHKVDLTVEDKKSLDDLMARAMDWNVMFSAMVGTAYVGRLTAK